MEVDAESVQQISERIAKSCRRGDESSKDDDVARPVDPNRGRSQIEPALDQGFRVAIEAAAMACIRCSVDGTDGCRCKNVGGELRILKGEQYAGFISAACAAARQHYTDASGKTRPAALRVFRQARAELPSLFFQQVFKLKSSVDKRRIARFGEASVGYSGTCAEV